MSKDYYKILGVAEFDTAENIKNSYRKLARKWHPDVAGNTPDVLAKFKEINEAYEVLSNQAKKAEYDRARRFYNYAKEGSAPKQDKTAETQRTTNPNKDNKQSFKFDWKEFMQKAQQKEAEIRNEEIKSPQKGSDIQTDIEITVFEAISGVEKVVNMLQTQTCPKCGGKKFANGSLCQHCMGKGEDVIHKKFTVKIPAGISDGSKIRLQGEGTKGLYGGRNGDLYITIHIKDLVNCQTQGLNVYKTVSIAPYEAVLGTELKIKTIDNETISVKISPNTKNGQKIRLSGCGLVQNNKIGDMIITIEINIPADLSEEERTLYKKLQELASNNNRGGLYDR